MVFPLGDVEKTNIFPIATYALIALNVIAYMVQIDRGEAFTVAYAATPFEITHGVDLQGPTVAATRAGNADDADPRPPLELPQGPVAIPIWMTLLTAMFMHGSPLHLAGNMLYLWIFGDNVEEVLGTGRYVLVYLACGLAGSALQIGANPDSVIPTLGASGAIAGVMGMYLIWFPHHRIRVLMFRMVTEMPALLVIGLWIALQLWSGYGAMHEVGETGGVAYLAHVGGAGAGVLFAFLYRLRARAILSRNHFHDWDPTIPAV
jgi:membrane associated rhomboid family serine protease